MTIADRRKLAAVATLVLVVNCMDLASTWIISPNLTHEWNILERQFGLGWAGLIGAKLLGGLIAILGYRYYLVNRVRCYPPAGLFNSEFYRYLIFGGRDTPFWSQTKRDGCRRAFVNLGYFWAGLQLLVIWVSFDNMMVGYGYIFPLRNVSELGYHLLQSQLIGSIVLYRFFTGNYKNYRRLGVRNELTAVSSAELKECAIAQS